MSTINFSSQRAVCLTLGLSLFASFGPVENAINAQEVTTPAASPKWSLPKQAEKPTLAKPSLPKPATVDTAKRLFDVQVQSAPTQNSEAQPASFPPELKSTQLKNAAPSSTQGRLPILKPSQFHKSEKTEQQSTTGQPRTALTVPIQTAPAQTEGQLSPPSTIHRDPFLKQTGNSKVDQDQEAAFGAELEIAPLAKEPAPLSFPEESNPRTTPPESSLFPANPSDPKPAPISTPSESFEIKPVETLKPSQAPQLSKPAPFSPSSAVEIQEAPPTVPVQSNPFPGSNSTPKAQVYNPPADEPVLLNEQPNNSVVQVSAETVHEVQRGENYWTISRQHFGTARYFAALAEYNKHRIPRPDRMKPGMFVLVPDSKLLDQRYPKMAGIVDAQPSPESLLAPGFFIQNGQPLYRIGKGDTLTEIAENHLGRTARWSQIVGMNRDLLKDGNTLKIGMVLRLPHDASQVVLAPSGETIR